MTSQQAQSYLQGLGARLQADGCDPQWTQWGAAPVLVARRADFRLRWMGTRLHLFTIAIALDSVDSATIEQFEGQAAQYAKQNKGGLPVGLQTGIALFPVVVADHVEPAAAAWAEEKQRARWAVMSRPVVVDVTQQRVSTFRGKPLVGRVYAGYLGQKSALYFG